MANDWLFKKLYVAEFGRRSVTTDPANGVGCHVAWGQLSQIC